MILYLAPSLYYKLWDPSIISPHTGFGVWSYATIRILVHSVVTSPETRIYPFTWHHHTQLQNIPKSNHQSWGKSAQVPTGQYIDTGSYSTFFALRGNKWVAASLHPHNIMVVCLSSQSSYALIHIFELSASLYAISSSQSILWVFTHENVQESMHCFSKDQK